MFVFKTIALVGAVLSLAAAPASSAPKQRDALSSLTPLAQKIFCLRNPEECRVRSAGKNVAAVDGRVVLNAQRVAELERVNRTVNAAIKPRAEKPAVDQWQIGAASGDCEDYVLTKRQMLNRLGWPSSSTLISRVRTKRGELHAVLLVRTDGGNFVLDNLFGSIRPASQAFYSWISTQNPTDPQKWQKGSGKI
jgi:predicted transglutaminase-like cysteine proteinase